jgi:hypothetical protein
MSTAFYRGQQLGREDLNIYIENANGIPSNPAEISYALYDFTTGAEVMVGNPRRNPVNPSVGEYHIGVVIPRDANIGKYRARWTFRELVGAPIQQVVQEFEVIDTVVPNQVTPVVTPVVANLTRRLRILLRDNSPDRNYRFAPPSHEETISQHNRVFGHIWEEDELSEYLHAALDMIIASPPRTPFSSIDSMVQVRSEWQTLLLTGAKMHALDALRYNMIHEDFDYSIGGISMSLDKASKYESAYQAASESFQNQLEKAKETVNFIAGLQQPRFGMGIRGFSAFGPATGAGVITPGKFQTF